MAVTASNLIMGPSQVYWATFGTTFPGDSTATVAAGAPAGSWTDLGGTNGGVELGIDQTVTNLEVDQIIMPVGGRVTAESVMLTVNMAELTLNNLQVALNQQATVSTFSTYSTLDPVVTSSATQPLYTSLIVDGWAPTLATGQPGRARFELYKSLAHVKLAHKFDKKGQTLWAVPFEAYFVAAGQTPYHVIYQTA